MFRQPVVVLLQPLLYKYNDYCNMCKTTLSDCMNEMFIYTRLEFVKPAIVQLTWHIFPRRPSSKVLTRYYLTNSRWNSLGRLKSTIQIIRVTQNYFTANAFMLYIIWKKSEFCLNLHVLFKFNHNLSSVSHLSLS